MFESPVFKRKRGIVVLRGAVVIKRIIRLTISRKWAII